MEKTGKLRVQGHTRFSQNSHFLGNLLDLPFAVGP